MGGGHLTKLGPRLSLIASRVRPGKCAADIGCDHGYLSAFLLKSGRCPKVLACDIHQMPLQKARETARLCDTLAATQFYLTDGLHGIPPYAAEDIVIAGMGGDLMARIVCETPWLRSEDVHLVLSPMTKAPQLRRALMQEGFAIEREEGVREGKFLYTVMDVCFTGVRTICTPLFALTGRLNENPSPDSKAYLLHQAQVLRTIAKERRKSSTDSIIVDEYNEMARNIEDFAAKGGSLT